MSEKIINTVKNALIFWSGMVLIVFGLVGLLFPVIPGILLVALGFGISTKSAVNQKERYIAKQLNGIKNNIKIKNTRVNKMFRYLSW